MPRDVDDPGDWALKDQPDLIADNVAQNTPVGGGVVLLHDTQPQTADALPKIIDYYTAANFELTSVRYLLAEKYGVKPDGIEASINASQALQPTVSDEDVPDEISSLAGCLT